MHVAIGIVLFHILVVVPSSRTISVRDYASSKLAEYSVGETLREIHPNHVAEQKFTMSSCNVKFDCKNTFKGRIIETEFNLLVLSGPELYVLNTNANSSKSTLDKLAVLEDVNSSPMDVQASFWPDEKIIIVLAFPTHYSIYKVPFDGSGEGNFLPPVQKITIIGEIPVKIALYRHREKLYCLLVSRMGEYRGILRLYNWHLMHFKEDVHQYVVGMSDVLYTNWHDNERAVIATIHAEREMVKIHLLDGYTLRQFQTLHIPAVFIRFIQLSGKVFLLICPSHHCDMYQWSERRFNHWRRVNLPDFHEFHTGHNVIIYRFNHTVFVSNRADLTPIDSINCTTSRIYLHKVHESNTIWAVSVFLEPQHLRFNFINIVPNSTNENSEETSGRHLQDSQSFTQFLECANNLKEQFNRIYGTLTKIASLNSAILRRDQPAEIPGKLIVKNITRISGNASVELAKVSMGVSATPTELLKNVAHLTTRKLELQTVMEGAFEMLSNSTHRHRRQIVESGKNRTNDGRQGEKLTSIRRQRIRVRNLRINSDKWKNFLLKSSSNTQQIRITSLKSLQATNLNISDSVNGINIEKDLYSPQELLQNKTFNSLRCKHLIVKNSLNSIHINDFFGLFAKGRSHDTNSFHVDQVIVENIQDMNFDSFYQSLFLRNTSREIDGNLIFYNVTRVREMETEGINGKPTDNLVPLHTNQIINSTIRINQFRVEHFEVDTVNDIKFREEHLALIGKDNHLEGPIQLYDLYAKDLVLAEDDKETPDRIIGTHIDDLSQVYMGQVTLKGNLHVGTLQVASKNNFLGDIPFNLSSLEDYWTKGLDQDFTNVIFYGNITAPQLHSDFVDHHPSEDFLTTRQERVMKNATLFLRAAHVAGSVKLNQQDAQTMANKISDSCVRVNERTVVRGVKNFTGNVQVQSLITTHLNDNLIAKMVLKNFTRMEFPSTKHFSHMHVAENLITGVGNVNIDRIFASDLRELIESCVLIDEPQNITFVQANEIQSRDIEVDKLNSVAFAKSIRDIEQMEIHLEIQGNVTFRDNAHLSRVNGVKLEEFLPLVAQSGNPLQLGGVKNFTERVRILEEFTVGEINDHSVDNWLKNALVNGTNQIVKEQWTVVNMKAPKIDVDVINGVKVKHLMDSEGNAHFETDLQVDEITVNLGDIYGKVNIDFNDTVKLLETPTTRRWGKLHVVGNVQWPLGSLSPLTELLTNAIHVHRDQKIYGEVHFMNVASVNNLKAHAGLNGVSVETLVQDSVRRRADNQVIFGAKHFLEPIEMRNLFTNHYLDVPIVNGVDLQKLNATMLRRHERSICIKDSWTFLKNLKTKHLFVHGKINGVSPENLITTTERYGVDIPPTLFHNMAIIGNLSVTFVDNLALDHLIYERARKRTVKNQDFRGFITFKDVILADYAEVFSVNGIEINSLFLTRAHHAQQVVGQKTCRGKLELLGPSSVSYLNGRDIVLMHHNSLFLDKDNNIAEYGFTGVQLHDGLRVREYLNGIHLDTFTYMENSSLSGAPGRMEIQEEIHEIMAGLPDGSTFVVPKKKRFVYFDYVNSSSSTPELSPRVVRSVNIDDDFGGWGCNRSGCLCSRRYSVKMLEDSNMVIRRVESVSHSQRAWNGVEISAGGNHVQNCISRTATGDNTTITFTVKHGGKVENIERIYPGRVFHVDFLKIKRDVLATIGTIQGNMTQIHLVAVDKITPKVSTLNTLSLSSSTTQIHVMASKKHVYLVVGTPKSTVDGSIFIYKLMKNATEFAHCQTIERHYNMIRCIDALDMIILGNAGSNFVNIFKLDESGEFKLFQSIKLQSTLRTLRTFALAENQFFVITLNNDNFHIYKYNYIEGWILICDHQYANIQSLTPFSLAGEEYLLATTADSAEAIAMYSQTEN